MGRYRVSVPGSCTFVYEVEADDAEHAIDLIAEGDCCHVLNYNFIAGDADEDIEDWEAELIGEEVMANDGV